jgi:VPDSG-CTERM motif
MPVSPNGAAAPETVIPMRTANISRSTPSNHRKTWRIWSGACFCVCAAGQTMTRSSNGFANLPNADASILAQSDPQNPSTTIDLGAGGTYTYLFAKYDGRNDNSQVWYVGDLSGIITIPANCPRNHGLSGWILFGPGTPGVPDGGTTVMLLGAALGALGIARRYIMS